MKPTRMAKQQGKAVAQMVREKRANVEPPNWPDVPPSGYKVCGDCGGKGRVPSDFRDDLMVFCPDCLGSGRIKLDQQKNGGER